MLVEDDDHRVIRLASNIEGIIRLRHVEADLVKILSDLRVPSMLS